MLRPDLMSFLRENLHPLHEKLLANATEVQESNYEKLTTRLSERYDGLSSDIQWIKEHIEQPYLIQEQIKSALPGTNAPSNQLKAKALPPVNENIPAN